MSSEKKFKSKCEVKTHLKYTHNIGVKFYYCDQDDCDQKFKSNGHLQRHLEGIQDIGKHKCDFCLGNRNSSIAYKDSVGSHKICRTCYNKATGKNSRIEHTWSDYLDKVVGTTLCDLILDSLSSTIVKIYC